MLLIVTPAGAVHFVYDELVHLDALGCVRIRRASHVEPDATGNWLVDLSPIGGPKLGSFIFRSEALAAERQWLDQHLDRLAAADA